MLNVGKLVAAPGVGCYYVEQVAGGREDYYAGEGEAAGYWTGSAASALRLSGEVSESGLTRLLAAQDPATGAELRRPPQDRAVAGYDLTFRAPKSVSIVFAITEAPVAAEAVAAHDAAVTAALRYLEREAAKTRRGRGGAITVDGNGLIAAAFRHRSSRAGDPLLHTHVVVANATRGVDGKWSALDGRLIYRHAKTAGYLYQAVLRDELTDRLRVRWTPVEHGVADIVGVPRRVIEHFSRRRAEVLEHLAERGETSARAAQVATLDSRRPKDYGVPVERLREQWRARAAEHGLVLRDLGRIQGIARRRPLDQPAWDRVTTDLVGPAGLTRQASTFTRRDVLQAFAEAAATGATVDEVEERSSGFLARPEIVAVGEKAGEMRFSTSEQLRLERELLDGARGRCGAGVAMASSDATAATIDRRPTLSGEQRELVTALTRSGHGVQIVRAAAGTGKTFALDAARDAWQASGVPALGCALSARAACELRDQAGLDATTIAQVLRGLEHGLALAPGAVLLVDEAGMVGTRDLARLAAATAQVAAKLVLVGDDRQLPEIDAGGAFRVLAEQLGATELREVRRQEASWDRDALGALRDGDVTTFADAYHRHGRIIAAPDHHCARRCAGDRLGSCTRRRRARADDRPAAGRCCRPESGRARAPARCRPPGSARARLRPARSPSATAWWPRATTGDSESATATPGRSRPSVTTTCSLRSTGTPQSRCRSATSAAGTSSMGTR